MEIDEHGLYPMYLNPTGGGGGGGGNQHITTTQTNPVVPDDMKPLADSMNAVATGTIGAPVNFGAIPGFDAPATTRNGPSLGSLLTSLPFLQGIMRANPVTNEVRPSTPYMPRRPVLPSSSGKSWGDMLSIRHIPTNQPTNRG